MLTSRVDGGRRHATTSGGGADHGSLPPKPSPLGEYRSRGERLGALLARCGHGDVTALGALYDETIGWTYPLACQAGVDSATADALTQAFYVHVWIDSGQFRRGTDSAVAWFLTRLGRDLGVGSNGRH